ncbi:MAG: hypothetical protein QM742_05705 [Aquabacterium sp.]
MDPAFASWTDAILLAGVLIAALLFKPWLALRHPPLQNPWLGAMLILPWVWWTQHLLPNGMALHVSGACLLVLMFGWPLAMWSLLPIGFLAQLIEVRAWPDGAMVASHIFWLGALPGTLALGMGLAVRRWMPQHLFVYILGRGFIVTALSVTLTGYLALWAHHKPETLATDEVDAGPLAAGLGQGRRHRHAHRHLCGLQAAVDADVFGSALPPGGLRGLLRPRVRISRLAGRFAPVVQAVRRACR